MSIDTYEKKPQCTWSLGGNTTCPHIMDKPTPRPKQCSTILDCIGNTPLVMLNTIPRSCGVLCNVYAKLEWMNPGGSVKDRIGLKMMEDAESKGLIKPGYTIIEATSGNTGIGVALVCAVKGYKCLVTMPEKMSQEKQTVLEALGATIVRTRTSAAWDDPDSHINVARKLQSEIPNSYIPDQYLNPGNALAHYCHTGAEILNEMNHKVDMLVIGAGTGGTLTGCARKFKEELPSCVIVGVDPHGSILARPESLNTQEGLYHVEGVGYDFIPRNLDHSVVDKWIKSSDKESFIMARRIIREEGILCGGSSGAALHYALELAKDLPAEANVVVIFPDSVRNYMTKFLDTNWMEVNGFLEPDCSETWQNLTVSDLKDIVPVPVLLPSAKVSEFISGKAIVFDGTTTSGIVDSDLLLKHISTKRITKDSIFSSFPLLPFRLVEPDTKLGLIVPLLKASIAVICNLDGKFCLISSSSIIKLI